MARCAADRATTNGRRTIFPVTSMRLNSRTVWPGVSILKRAANRNAGKWLSGQVILNRVKNPAFPSRICDVVYQNIEQRNACQFSFACDGIEDRIRSTKHYKIAQKIAREVTDGTTFLYEIGDSTHFHTTYVRPKWAVHLTKTDRIGQHIFYRSKKGGWS